VKRKNKGPIHVDQGVPRGKRGGRKDQSFDIEREKSGLFGRRLSRKGGKKESWAVRRPTLRGGRGDFTARVAEVSGRGKGREKKPASYEGEGPYPIYRYEQKKEGRIGRHALTEEDGRPPEEERKKFVAKGFTERAGGSLTHPLSRRREKGSPCENPL